MGGSRDRAWRGAGQGGSNHTPPVVVSAVNRLESSGGQRKPKDLGENKHPVSQQLPGQRPPGHHSGTLPSLPTWQGASQNCSHHRDEGQVHRPCTAPRSAGGAPSSQRLPAERQPSPTPWAGKPRWHLGVFTPQNWLTLRVRAAYYSNSPCQMPTRHLPAHPPTVPPRPPAAKRPPRLRSPPTTPLLPPHAHTHHSVPVSHPLPSPELG